MNFHHKPEVTSQIENWSNLTELTVLEIATKHLHKYDFSSNRKPPE
jgi:hypothetical protein